MIRGGNPQIVHGYGSIQHSELPKGHLLNVLGQPAGESPIENKLGFFVLEVPDHVLRV